MVEDTTERQWGRSGKEWRELPANGKSMFMKTKRMVVVFLVILIMIGCGIRGGQGGDSTTAAEDSASERTVHWGMADYREGIVPTYDREEQYYSRVNRFRTVDGSDYYSLDEYFIYERRDDDFSDYADRRYSLTHLDGNTLETETTLCESYFMEEGPLQGGIVSAIDSGDGEIRLLLQCFAQETGKAQHCYALTLNRDGTFGDSIELKDTLETCGLLEKPYTLLREFAFDKQGYFYFLNNDHDVLYVLDAAGELVGAVDSSASGKVVGAPGLSTFGEEARKMEFFCKSAEGDCIWIADDMDRGERVYFVFEQNGKRELLREDAQERSLAYLTSYGEMYYIEGGKALFRKNLSEGVCECIYQSDSRDLESGVALLQNDRGEILCVKEDEEGGVSVTTYSPNAVSRDVTITLYSYDFCQPGTPLDSIIKAFEQRHPGVHIQAEFAAGDEQERGRAWIQMTTELAKGKGPDLFYIPRREMKLLAVKNALMDLDSILPAECREQIYGAVLDYGRVEDELYGLTFVGSFRTLLVPDEVWSGDHWSLEDVMGIVKKREESGSPYVGVCNDRYSDDGMTAVDMLKLLLEGLEESSFLNPKERTCHFDSPEFQKLLQLCMQYGKPEPQRLSNDETTVLSQYKAFLEERLLCHELSEYRSTFEGFSQTMAGLEDSCHVVGFPTDGECGNYFVGKYTMAVNKNTEEVELITEFLRFLYTYEVQVKTYAAPVRRDFLKECVVDKVGWSDSCYLHISGSNRWQEIPQKPDGTTYLEEYLELMESCVSRSDIVEEVQSIVCEEAKAYFRGEKEAEQVAKIIQSRVNLYLSE